jgi:hypothetical protein
MKMEIDNRELMTLFENNQPARAWHRELGNVPDRDIASNPCW